jgi:hypothetical protein
MRQLVLSFAMLLVFVIIPPSHAQEPQESVTQKRAEKELEEYWECRSIKDTDLKDQRAPTFEDYHATAEALVRHPKVDTKTTVTGRRYRTVLRDGVQAGANFAGHYAVIGWGCGSSCSTFAVVNLKTGRVITPVGVSAVSGVHLDFLDEKFMPDGFQGYWGYRFRLDSRLLVLVGAVNEKEAWEGAYYLVLQNDELKPIHRTRVEKKCVR